jgi:hypothetical protein
MLIVLRFDDNQPDAVLDLGNVSREKAMNMGGELYVYTDNINNFRVLSESGQELYSQNPWTEK